MVELTQEEKEQYKQQRLHQYSVQMFHLQMDIVAYTATGNTQGAAHAQAEIAKLEMAYAAVEAME